MSITCTNPNKSGKIYRALRALTVIFAVFAPVAMIGTAVALTLIEGDWWFNLFLVYLGAIAMLSLTVSLSLLTLLWELTRRARRKYGEDLRDTSFTSLLHRILSITAVTGLLTAIFLPLVLFDLLNGGFAMIHLAVGIVEVTLYAVLGVYAVIQRIRHHHAGQ